MINIGMIVDNDRRLRFILSTFALQWVPSKFTIPTINCFHFFASRCHWVVLVIVIDLRKMASLFCDFLFVLRCDQDARFIVIAIVLLAMTGLVQTAKFFSL